MDDYINTNFKESHHAFIGDIINTNLEESHYAFTVDYINTNFQDQIDRNGHGGANFNSGDRKEPQRLIHAHQTRLLHMRTKNM